MSENAADPDFWNQRWNEDRIGFHRDAIGHAASEFGERVLGRDGRVLVPLCGKSLDLVHLESLGHDVVGIEVAERAARDFHREQQRPFGIDHPGGYEVLHSGGIAFHVANFFDVELPEPCDRWFDRAAVIALPPDTRPRYAEHLETLVTRDAIGLVVTVEYDDSVMAGPPFSVSEAELRNLFPDRKVERLERRELIDDEARWRERGLTSFVEVISRAS